MTDTRIIKKYPNRRLYDTGLSRYVTLQDVRQLVADDVDFVVLEQRSGADITRSVLLQVIVEQEQNGGALLSRRFLSQVIRSYGSGSATQAAGHLERSMTDFLQRQMAMTGGA
jgi:polyhydroxyalkanoate synthesis repressor PhaR